MFDLTPEIRIHVLPGGCLPIRKSNGAIGFDACIRAIVHPTEKDPNNPNLRKTLFDFEKMPEEPEIRARVCRQADSLVYRLKPGERVLVGLGFVTEMKFPLFYWVAPRSGLATRHGITVGNAPGTVDSDFRGEAGAIVTNSGHNDFDLEWGLRIVQIIFQYAVIPNFNEVSYESLSETERSGEGFGSTGIYQHQGLPLTR